METKGLIKKYKVGSEIITALAGVDIKIYKGEFVAVLGTSGSGKSTLLNMISGLERPTKGDIIIGGTRLNKVSERNMARFRSREMGFIFQAYNLIPSLTAMENVTLPLMLQGVSKKKREKRAKAMLIELGLGKRLHNKPSQLSGGQQQRVAIARSLVTEPKIIFADEPTGNLDTKTTIEILSFLQQIVRKRQCTLIMVSHDLEVAQYADRIIHMRDGKVIKITEGEAAIKELTKAEEIIESLPDIEEPKTESPQSVQEKEPEAEKAKILNEEDTEEKR
ncbi:MAG: macrolide ABC transporter ATP-binding protein [Clostridiales bacterium]|nr:MAG: macrolide ABC transporter ATP-binding protein [Clostridiales bacterium]